MSRCFLRSQDLHYYQTACCSTHWYTASAMSASQGYIDHHGNAVQLSLGRNSFDPVKDGGQLINPNAFEHDFSAFGYTGLGKAVSTIYGPSYRNLDIAFTKNTRISERINFRFGSNFFNAFNNHYFLSQGSSNGGPGYAFVTDVAASGGSFGKWNGAVTSPRTIQFVGRFEF